MSHKSNKVRMNQKLQNPLGKKNCLIRQLSPITSTKEQSLAEWKMIAYIFVFTLGHGYSDLSCWALSLQNLPHIPDQSQAWIRPEICFFCCLIFLCFSIFLLGLWAAQWKTDHSCLVILRKHLKWVQRLEVGLKSLTTIPSSPYLMNLLVLRVCQRRWWQVFLDWSVCGNCNRFKHYIVQWNMISTVFTGRLSISQFVWTLMVNLSIQLRFLEKKLK